MWMLKDSKGSIKYLKPNKITKVGRKDADIILENDSSISRAHASLTVTLKEQVQISEESSTCLIKDNNSKYGSFIVRNGTKVKVSKEGLELHHGDIVTFGLQNCTYSVEYIHLVTVISRLNADHKQKLKIIMDEIGGLIIDFYSSHCTHVTATTAATTTKIISALISGIPIVGISYWIQVRKCIEDNKILPDSNHFILSLKDIGVNVQKVSLKPNPLRSTLFKKKTFIFFSEKSFKEHKVMIQQAGGAVKICPMSLNIPDDFFSDNYIVMKIPLNDSSAEELTRFDTLLQNKLREKHLRTVNETEIPLAVIYACLDQYCNPKYDFTQLLKRKCRKEDTSEVLALDTQEIACTSINENKKYKISRPHFLPETVDIQNNSFHSQRCPSNHDKRFETSNEKPMENKDDCNKFHVKSDNIKTSDSKLKPIESINFTGNKVVSSSILSNNEDGSHDKNKGKNKRQRETSELDEISDNIQQFRSNTKRSLIEIPKTKSVSGDTKNTNIFNETKSAVAEVNDNKTSTVDKWGFKKSNKKVRDFDLDLDMDIGESQKIFKKNKHDVLDNQPKKIAKRFDLDEMDVKETKKSIKNSKNDASHSSTVECAKNLENDLEITEVLEKEHGKPETILHLEQNVEIKESVQLKVKPINIMLDKGSYIKSNKKHISADETDKGCKIALITNFKNEIDVDNHKRIGKMFKKNYNNVPIARMPLSEMTIWKPS